ncbi:MAG: hypothetical protein RQM92_09900 [Candidatus Syntrophopropionicum ammoniitolerans]
MREKRDREILQKIFEELQLGEKDRQLINKMYEKFKKANEGVKK